MNTHTSKVGVGHSTLPEMGPAVVEAAKKAVQDMNGTRPKLFLVYLTHNHGIPGLEKLQQLVRGATSSDAHVCGARVNGISVNGLRYDALFGADKAVGVAVFGEGYPVAASLVEYNQSIPEALGERLARDV